MKAIGLSILGIGALGCVIYPMGYIPSQLYFITEMGAGVTWGVLIGLVVLGAALTWMGMKSEKTQSQG